MSSGAAASDNPSGDSPHVPLPPAQKYRESSEPGMSGAWSASEVKLLVDAVDKMKRQSARLDWDSIREIYLPFRTAKAIEQRYYAYVRDASDNSE